MFDISGLHPFTPPMLDYVRTAVLALLLLTACSKDKPPVEQAAEPEPAPSGEKSVDESAAPESSAPNEPQGAAVEKKPAPVAKKVIPARVSQPTLPASPEENMLMVIRNAESGCTARAKVCRARDLLAAKLTQDIDRATELLKKGTDQQKRALRLALLRCTDPKTDPLLVKGLLGADGLLDTRVLNRVKLLRTEKAVPGLQKYLKKAAGPEAVAAIDALGYLAGDASVKALTAAFADKRHTPYRGEICRAMARRLNTGALESATTVTRRLNSTERQLTGCAGTQAAIRMLTSSGGLNLNIEGQRLPVGSVLFYQRSGQPDAIYLDVAPAGTTSCSNAFKGDLTLRLPLARKGEPALGDGVVAEVYYKGKPLGSSGSFLMRLDTFEFIAESGVTGAVHVSHTRAKDPRIILSGRFRGTYCGVLK